MLTRHKLLPALCIFAGLTASAQQDPEGIWTYSHQPDRVDVRYGPHERHVLDFWKAKSSRPTPLIVYYHPGGFNHGDKSWIERYDKALREICLERGISVATANYRYSTQAPYPACFDDCARALQYLRAHAKEFHIDPKAVASTGASAGAGISLWLGFHDDMADPKSSDPVKRESTRISAAGVVDAQSSYDPRAIAKIINVETANVGALRTLFAVPKGIDLTEAKSAFQLYEDASPVHHLKAGGAPAFLYYTTVLKPAGDHSLDIHSPKFGIFLKERMDKLGIECVVKVAADYQGDRRTLESRDMVDFLQKYFTRQ